jgi:Fe-S cluster biogenesis protein NfuA
MTVDTDTPATFETRAARIDATTRAVARLEPEARVTAEDAVAAIEEHHAAVLRALVARLRADDRGRELLYEAVDDAEVYAALVKAGIVRPTLAMRAVQVLDGVRPYLTSHGGDVELVRIDQGVAYVRLLGACQSCGSSTETLRDSVAEALLEHLPELSSVEEVAPDSAPTSAFIPLSSVSFGRPNASGRPAGH